MEELLRVIEIVGGMAGLAAVFAVLINIAKSAGILPDGEASKVSTILNMVAMIVVFVLSTWFPEIDLAIVDQKAAFIAQFIGFVSQFVVEFGLTKLAHVALKGAPVLGFSHSK